LNPKGTSQIGATRGLRALGTSVSNGNIVVELRDGVLALTLNRPQKLNILDIDTRKALLKAFKEHEDDDRVRCVVLSSRGEVFSAGADLKYVIKLTPAKATGYAKFVKSILGYIEAYPKPTIGVVSGLAVGGALELLLVLDIVVASPEAKFGLTELNVGLIPGGGGSQRLPRQIGVRKAKEMIFTGELISAQEALDLGLVNRVVPREALVGEVDKICARIKEKSPVGLRLAKESVNRSYHSDCKEGLQRENRMYTSLLASADAKKRLKAFFEGRHERR
jgi:enoyl-CoA hydratase